MHTGRHFYHIPHRLDGVSWLVTLPEIYVGCSSPCRTLRQAVVRDERSAVGVVKPQRFFLFWIKIAVMFETIGNFTR